MKRSGLMLICVAWASTGVWAAESPRPATAEGLFVMQAAQGSLAELELAKLAQTRSADASVKAFAAAAVEDYGKLRRQLKPIAERKNLDFPTSLDDEHARVVHSVSAKAPSEFDAEFSKQVIDAHSKLMTAFADASALSDKELAAYARAATPTLKRQEKSLAALPAKVPAGTDSTKTIAIAPGGSRAVSPSPTSGEAGSKPQGDVARTPSEVARTPTDPDVAGTVAADSAAKREAAAAAEAAKQPPADAARPDKPDKP